MKVSDATRNSIWQNMLDAERYYRYYERMSEIYSFRSKLCDYTIYSLSLISLLLVAILLLTDPTGILSSLYRVVIIVNGIVIVTMAIWDAIDEHGYRSVGCRWVASDYLRTAMKWGSLWKSVDAYEVEEQEARSRLRWIVEEENIFQHKIDVPLDEKVNEYAAKNANRYVSLTYGNGVDEEYNP